MHGLPIRFANMVDGLDRALYEEPGRYNWMFQYYLRAEGLAAPLGGLASGRLHLQPRRTSAEDFEADGRAGRCVRQGRMRDDGWWSSRTRG